MKNRFNTGDIVQHFKRELLTEEERAGNMYLYEIVGVAIHSETGEPMMVYRPLYDNGGMYVRPLEMFLSEVDHEKYPSVKQKYRFELVNVSIGDDMDKLLEIKEAFREFNKERDWDQFHTPENLAKSISIEAGELLECFQWDNRYDKEAVCEELADVFSYCVMMADALDVDIKTIVMDKLEKTKCKYPVDKAKGISTKYDKL